MKKAKQLGHPNLFLVRTWYGQFQAAWKRVGIPALVFEDGGVKLCVR